MPFTDSLRFVEIIRADQSTLTAEPADVAAGKVYIGTTKKLEVGNLPVLTQQDADIVLVSGEEYTVEYGKNPKEYKVKVATLGDQTPATASAEHILYPYNAWVNGVLITGSMPDNGSVEEELLAGQSYIIPLGYHDGSGMVTTVSLANQTPGNAEADDITAGTTAWVNGVEIAGTLPVITDEEIQLSAGQEYVIPFGKHSGNGRVTAMALADQTLGTAESGDILDGETAWVNGVEVTGTIPRIASQEITLPFNGEYIIPMGYHSGLGKVTQDIPAIEDQIVIAPAFEQQIIPTAGNYIAQDILVPGINALNYQRTGSEWIVNDEAVAAGTSTKSYATNVDNWHDNATLNVYYFEMSTTKSNVDNGILHGILFIDWDNPESATYTYQFEDTSNTGISSGVEVSLSLEDGTNAHTFTWSIDDIQTYGIKYFRVRELFHARQYGDDHDVDDAQETP